MTDLHHLNKLLRQIVYHRHYDGLEGLEPIQSLLETAADEEVADYLTLQLPTLSEKVRGGIAFVLAHYHCTRGDLAAIRRLFAYPDVEVQESVLNGLWGEPNANQDMGPGIVALAIEGMRHPASQVRTEAASVIQNQNAWKVDVSEAIEPLLGLLQDSVARVRQQAAYAIGNVAKRKYDLAAHLSALCVNLRHEDMFVRQASAWALGKLSRRGFDIAPCVGDLVRLLASPEEYAQLPRSAASALLHHARKSSRNYEVVCRQMAAATFDPQQRETARFLQKLALLG